MCTIRSTSTVARVLRHAVALTLTTAVGCSLAAAQIVRPIGAVNASTLRGGMYNPNNLTSAPLVGMGSWEIVAGATMAGLAPSVNAAPMGTNTFAGPGRTAIPTKFATGRIINGITGNGITGPVVVPAFRYPLGMPKPIGGGANTVTAGPLVSGNFRSQATATVTFTAGVGPRPGTTYYNANATGTSAFVTPGRGGPARSAGALVLDPLSFQAHNGDVLATDLLLNSGMTATPTPGDPNDVEGFLFEAGTDLPGISPSVVGVGDDGEPLLYKLSITFDEADPNPMISLVDDRQDGQFDVSGTNTPLTDQQIEQEVASDLSFDPVNGWTLTNTEDLFTFVSNPLTGAPAGGETIDLEMDSGVVAAETPEPGAAALALAAAVPLAIWRMRRRPRRG